MARGQAVMRCLLLAVCATVGVLCVTGTAHASSGPYINLTQSFYAGPGIGFDFSIADNGTAVQAGAAFTTKMLPSCTQEGLDVEYFYVYGCVVPTSFVRGLAAAVPGFQFASDKSITTRVPASADDLLLANAWNLTLVYDAAAGGVDRDTNVRDATAACKADARRAMAGTGCVVSAACGGADDSSRATSVTHSRERAGIGGEGGSITVGCGSLTCVGCVLPAFWSQFGFTSAHFDSNQA